MFCGMFSTSRSTKFPTSVMSTDASARTENKPNVRSGDQRADGQMHISKEAQISLVTALRKVIIPLIQAAVPNHDLNYLDDVEIGDEADDLLAALQKYISTVVRNGTKTRVVDLTETSEKVDRPELLVGPSWAQEVPSDEPKGDSSTLRPNNVKNTAGRNVENFINPAEEMVIFRGRNENGEPVPLRKLMTELREYVFNTLPIRLLHFRKSDVDDSKLEISLLERGEVHSYLQQRFLKKLVTHEEIPATYVAQGEDYPTLPGQYAILSHTWLLSSPEVTYDDWRNGDLDLSREGYRKLVNFCRVAEADYRVNFGWMDTVCIDKSSSSELDESIRSMYKWYQRARICINYLADTISLTEMGNDRWFTRGWTLQELLGPDNFKFHKRDWTRFDGSGDYNDPHIPGIIQNATGIPPECMFYREPATISVRMQWAATRQVTRGEDAAYSLMGLFGVNMSIAYGEGAERAFFRLMTEILSSTKSTDVLDIFNFGGEHPPRGSISAMLPISSKAYLHRSDFQYSDGGDLIEPLVLTHLGLRIPVLLLPAVPAVSVRNYTPIGDYYTDLVNYTVAPRNHTPNFGPISPTSFRVLDVAARENQPEFNGDRYTFAVLNCSPAINEADIRIPVCCLAATFMYWQEVGNVTATSKMDKAPTDHPITFELHKKSTSDAEEERALFYTIARTELAHHGMQLLTMYL